MDYQYTLLILCLPIVSFLILGLAGKWLSHRVAGLIGTLSIGTVAVLSYYTAIAYFGARGADGTFATIVPYNFEWLPFYIGDLHFDMGIMLDPISVMMLIVISTVSLMVHIYSFGYMHGERGFQRYYAFLSLFTMSMLGLVVATNIFQMYMFWELVGVCSYLLIGFYFTENPAIAASKKAFIVTRFADLGFLVGILVFGYYTGSFSFDFTESFQYAAGALHGVAPDASKAVAAGGFILPTALFLMFIGGAGKSAMFPLHIWLPDAMEGPTPVSALIHAATMVVAGVFQVARMFPMWIQYAPETLHYVAWIGAFTAFYAAAVAMAQSDIKRVLAFSTISQIAFMMVALGVCMPGHEGAVVDNHGSLGYMASMYHLFTHAMFKATLFLCAGCIIHAVHSNEMSAMGGMRKYMPVTHITFLIATLAISGIPPFSGFFSKDEILSASFAYSPVMGWVMTGIAAMTAFYMFRLYFGIFWGTENKELHEELKAHGHFGEAPLVMTVPLVLLTLFTVFMGWTLPGTFGSYVSATGQPYEIHLDPTIAITSVVIACISIGLATWIYVRSSQPVAERLKAAMPHLHKWAYHRFYLDEVYQFVTHRIIFALISKPIAWFDRHIVDGALNGLANGTNYIGESIRPLQSGRLQQYAYVFLMGIIVLFFIMII
ncbi:MAG: NADH-quinone oxidoreductase subunit L [Bacteroidaceae bacterium]|nr:NADH-quinone oxidoreductase subunit L [Bacteroidaceae bacterium]MBR7029229.1 NADH-quinone oxidoreductase subunit L [Bacteroidaceae bacterium]